MEPETQAARPRDLGRVSGALLVALSGASFGTLSVFNRQLGQAGVSVPMMLTLRFAGGALVLWALAWKWGEARRIGLDRWISFAILGVLYVAGSWAYFESATRIPVALTALLLYVYPVVVAMARRLWFGESLGPSGLLALVLSSAGIALAVGSPSGPIDPWGVGLGLATALIYTGYVILGAKAQRGVSAVVGSAWLMTIAAGLFAMGAIATGTWDLTLAWSHWPPIVGLIVLGTALPIPLLLTGLARVGPTQGSIISSAEPISAAVCGALFLGETLTPVQLGGVALVLVSLTLLALRLDPRGSA